MIGKKNSGKFQQDAIVGRFTIDARKPQEVNAIVKAGLAQGERNRKYREEREARLALNPGFVR